MTDKLSVCLMNDSFPPIIDGVANAVSNYARILTASGDRAVVVTPSYPGADDSGLGYPVVRYPSIDMTKLVGYRTGYPFSPAVQERLEQEHVGIIHSHCPVVSTYLARIMREALHVPIVFTYHTKFDIDIGNAIKLRLMQDEAKRLLVENISACDEVWVVSNGAGENLRSMGYEGEYTVMPNGVDLPRGRADENASRALLREYGIPENVPVFLFVGRLMWYKGLRLIIDALAGLNAQGRDFRMVFVGDGGNRDEVEQSARESGIYEKCVFTGAVCDRETIRQWYTASELFVFPSTFDTNGLVVREAASCALASVLVRGSCAAEGIADGETGYLIDENAESLRAVLERACDDRPAFRETGERAMNGIYVSWEDSVARARERYMTVLDGFRSGRRMEKPDSRVFSLQAELLDSIAESRRRSRETREETRERLEHLRRRIDSESRRISENAKQRWQSFDRFL